MADIDFSTRVRDKGVTVVSKSALLSYTGLTNFATVIGNDGGTFVSSTDSLTNDGGKILPKAGGGHWVRVTESKILRAEWYLKADYVPLTGLSTSGTTVTSATSVFTVNDIGKTICIFGAGGTGISLGDEHEALITGFTSGTVVTIATAASTNVTAQAGFMGTNNSPLLQAVINANGSDFEFQFEADKAYYFGDNSGNTDNAPVKFASLSNIKMNGNNATLYFRGAVPNSYPPASGIKERNLFTVSSCNNVTFTEFIFRCCSQTFSRGVTAGSTANELGYYTSLGGIAVTYNRKYNKQANSGTAVYNLESSYINVTNCSSYEVGSFYETGGVAANFKGGLISGNYIYGYCITAIFPGPFSTISNNIIDNEPAHVLDFNDLTQIALRGTSHAIYVTTGYSGVVIDGNTFNYCRGYTIQFNTGSGIDSYANTVTNNKFYKCFSAGSLIGNDSRKQISWTDNTIEKCGYLLIDHPNLKLNLSGNKWSGIYDLLPTASTQFSIEAFYISSVKEFVCSDEFYGKTSTYFGNSGVVAIANSANVGELLFTNCIVDKTNRAFLSVATPLDLIGSFTLKNSVLGTGIYLNYTNTALPVSPRYNIVIDGNDFTYNTDSSQPIYSNMGFIFKNNIIRIKSGAAHAVYLGAFVTNANDMIVSDNTFINEGSSTGFRASDASVNNKVIFINNKVVGSVEIKLDSNTMKHRSNTYSTVTSNYIDNVAVVGTSGNYLVGTTTDNATDKLQVNGTVKSTQFKLSALNTAPASATATGTTGEIRITADYVYVCVATNTWVRNALTTWS